MGDFRTSGILILAVGCILFLGLLRADSILADSSVGDYERQDHRYNVPYLPSHYPNEGILINIPSRTLVLVQRSQIWGRFPIAVGKTDTPTPIGEFEIINRVREPWWYPTGRQPVPAGPDNPLGPWWLGLNKPGYGIHGNNNIESIGQMASQGCIRMKNDEVSRIVGVVDPGTSVDITYQQVEIMPQLKDDRVVWKMGLYGDPYELGEIDIAQDVAKLLAEEKLYIHPSVSMQLNHQSEKDFSKEIPLQHLPEELAEQYTSDMLPYFFNNELAPFLARKIDEQIYVPIGPYLERSSELAGIQFQVIISSTDRQDDGEFSPFVIRDGHMIHRETGSPLSERAPEIEDGKRDLNIEPPIFDVRITQGDESFGVFFSEDNQDDIRGELHDDQLYVPLYDIEKHLTVETGNNRWGAWTNWYEFYVNFRQIAVYQRPPSDNETLVPASVVEEVFGRRITWDEEREKVEFLGRELSYAEWDEDRPWVCIENLAGILGWEWELKEFTVHLAPRL